MASHVAYFLFLFFRALQCETIKNRAMDLTAILDEMQETVSSLQDKIDAMRKLESYPSINVEILMTRKEAAAFIGRSLRDLDRLCASYKIQKEVDKITGNVRIKRSSLLRFQGIIPADMEGKSDFDALIDKYK